jgi:hypothetical protein
MVGLLGSPPQLLQQVAQLLEEVVRQVRSV